MRMQPHETLVIVGGGMASHALCHALSKTPRAERPRIIVFGEEPTPAYNRVRLSEVMLGLSPDQLELAPRSWYQAHGITLHCDERVTHIDREARELHTHRGQRVRYDRLVLATGSRAFRPPIAGIDDPACFVYRGLEDLEALRQVLPRARRGAVLGGGLLGLEAAKVLHDQGLSVVVLEAAGGLMARQLDLQSGECLQRHVEGLGLQVRVQVQVRAIERTEQGLRLCLAIPNASAGADDLEDLQVDLLVVAAGVRPRDELAQASGLVCGVRGGVIVDDLLTTSDPAISAIGECASYHGQSFGLVRPCQDMARALASTLRNAPTRFESPNLSCQLKLLGVEVAALGDYGNEHRLLACVVGDGRRTLILDGKRLVGAIVIGPWPELPHLEQAIALGTCFSQRALDRFEDSGTLFGARAPLPVVAWPSHAVVCNCAQVSAGELRAQIDGGACDLAMLRACTGVTLGCGSCTPLVGAFLGDAKLSAIRVRTHGLLGVSLAAAAAALLTYVSAPFAFADSIADPARTLDLFWRDGTRKQLTGFVIVGLIVLALVLSLRKRAHWPKLGQLNLYRTLHAVLGLCTLIVLVAHTGFRLGHNLNLALMASFLGLNLLGAGVGVVSTLETKHGHAFAVLARRLRPAATLLHILLVWPLPVLLTLHVLATYYF